MEKIKDLSLKASEMIIEMTALYFFKTFQCRINSKDTSEVAKLIEKEIEYNKIAYMHSVKYLDLAPEYLSKEAHKLYMNYHKLSEKYQTGDIDNIPKKHSKMLLDGNVRFINHSYDYEAVKFDKHARRSLINARESKIKRALYKYDNEFCEIVRKNYEYMIDGKPFRLFFPNGTFIDLNSDCKIVNSNGDNNDIRYSVNAEIDEYYFVSYRLLYEKYLQKELNKMKNKDVDSNENRTKQPEMTGLFKLSKKISKVDLIRILDALHELGAIENTYDGERPDKNLFMKKVGEFFSCNLKDYDSPLSKSLNERDIETHLAIFEKIKDVIKEKHHETRKKP